MVLLHFILLNKIVYLSASNLVNYKFGSNFGQIFYDYSGTGNHGENGITLGSDANDTRPIDRGAYFDTQNKIINLPPNNIKSDPLKLGAYFSIITWVYPMYSSLDPAITCRYKINLEEFFILRFDGAVDMYTIIDKSYGRFVFFINNVNTVYSGKH